MSVTATALLAVSAPAVATETEPLASGTAVDVREENAQAPGGSNYNFYSIDQCDREPFGVLKNLHDVEDVVRDQLATMIASGQQRLRIGVFHGHDLQTGTVLDSAGGDIAAQYRQNLTDLLAIAGELGFAEVILAMHPLGPNDPNGWQSFDEGMFQENWQLIQNLRPIMAESGMQYRIDLGNELTPAPSQPMTLQYSQRLWDEYVSAFGKDDTLGFSVIGMEPQRIAQIPAVYGDEPPHLFDLHFYGDEQADEYEMFVDAHDQLEAMNLTQGWIVGETHYNDAAAAEGIRRAIDETGQRVYWVAQWPLTRERTCDDVDVAAPTEFDNFVEHGFGAVPADDEGVVLDVTATDSVTGAAGDVVKIETSAANVGSEDLVGGLVDFDVPEGATVVGLGEQEFVAGDERPEEGCALVSPRRVECHTAATLPPGETSHATFDVQLDDGAETGDLGSAEILLEGDNGGSDTAVTAIAVTGGEPTEEPTEDPTDAPTDEPTEEPTDEPTEEPTDEPTEEPTDEPTDDGAVTGSESGDENLPDTGSSATPALLAAAGLLLVGGAAVAMRARRS